MTFHTRTLKVFSLLVGLGFGSGCGTAPAKAPVATPVAAAPAAPPAPPPAAPEPTGPVFTPPAVAQSALVGSLVTVAPSRIIGDLDGLSQRLNLPLMLGRELLSSIGTQGIAGNDARVSDLVDRLDPQSAVAFVWTLPPEHKAKGLCAALTLKTVELAKRTADEMGAPSPLPNGVVERHTAGGDVVFTAIKHRTLFISGSAEALVFGGGLAEAAQVPPTKGQMVLTVMSQALAKASGKSPEMIIADMTSLAKQGLGKDPAKNTKAQQQMVVAILESGVRLALDSSAIRLVVEAGPSDGLLIQAELVPALGTGLATLAARRAPYVFDVRLPVRSDGTSVFAVGDMWMLVSPFGKLLEASGPAGHAAARDLKSMFDVSSEWSCVVDPAQTGAGISSLCSAAVKQGSAPKAALDAAVAWATSQHTWEAELEGRKARPLKIKRSVNMVEIVKRIENKEPATRALAKVIAGGDSFKSALTVKNGRLLQAVGANPKEVLARYGSGASAEDAPLVAAALARTKGDDGMACVDVISLVLRLFGQSKGLPAAGLAAIMSAIPGMADLKAPFRFALRGGGSLVGEFHIPLGSLDNVAKVVRGLMGAMPPDATHPPVQQK